MGATPGARTGRRMLVVCLSILVGWAAAAAHADTGIVANDLGAGLLGTPGPQEHAITEFDPSAFAIGPSFTTSGGTSLPIALEVSLDGTTAYVVNNSNDSSLSVVNLASGMEASNISLGTGLVYATLSPDGHWLYTGGTDSVVPVDVTYSPPRPQATISLPGASGGDNQIAFSPDGKTAWVTSPGAGAVYPIDVATQAIGTAIPTGLGASGVAVSPDGKTLWVANGNADTDSPVNTVTELSISGSGSTATASTVNTFPITSGDPDSLALTPDGSRLFIALYHQHAVTWLDTATGNIGSTLNTGGRAASNFAWSSDGKTLYVSGGDYTVNTGDVAEIATAGTPSVIGVVNGFDDPTDVAITRNNYFTYSGSGSGGGGTGGGPTSGTGGGGSGGGTGAGLTCTPVNCSLRGLRTRGMHVGHGRGKSLVLSFPASVSMLCGGTGGSSAWHCSALVQLAPARHAKSKLATIRSRLGFGRQRAVSALTLTRGGSALLRREHRLQAKLTFTIGAGPGLPRTTRTFKLTLRAPAH